MKKGVFEIRAKLIKGFPVVDLEDGSMAGRVQNLILDPAGKKVAGFLVGEKGLLKGRSQIILYEQVSHIGRDAITINNKENLAAEEDHPEQEVSRDYSFLGNSVISSEGDYIARVQDFTFSIQTGEIESLLLYDFRSKEKIDRNIFLSMHGVQKLGKDYVIAEADYAAYLSEGEKDEGREDEEHGKGKEAAYSLEMRAIEFALHKEAAFTVKNLHGEIIVEKGQRITYDTIERARASGKLYQVLFAAGAGELLDSIDFTLEKLDQGSDRLLQAWHIFKKKSSYIFRGTEHNGKKDKQHKEAQAFEGPGEEEQPYIKEEYKPGEIQHSLAEVFDNIKEIWRRLEKEVSREGKELAHESREKMKEYALNKKANFSIRNGEGNILLQGGEIITEEIIAAAEAANKIPSLFLAAISSEAEESLSALGEKIRDTFH